MPYLRNRERALEQLDDRIQAVSRQLSECERTFAVRAATGGDTMNLIDTMRSKQQLLLMYGWRRERILSRHQVLERMISPCESSGLFRVPEGPRDAGACAEGGTSNRVASA